MALSAAVLLTGAHSAESGGGAVLLASSRGGWVEAIDPLTLATVSRIRTPEMTESVASNADGSRLFVAAPRVNPKGCCAIYALDPASMILTPFEWPAQAVTIAGGRVLAQRSNRGIDVFDAHTLQPMTPLDGSGFYRLRASPDGRSIFGVKFSPEPTLDLFHADTGQRIVSHVLPAGASLAGTWIGGDYYLFEVESDAARLHHVRSDNGQFEETVASAAPEAFPVCQETPYEIVTAGVKAAIYAQFGLKASGACASPGGYAIADPAIRSISPRVATRLYFRQMVAMEDGQYLYGLDAGAEPWQQVRIVKLDAATGAVVAEKKLAANVWYLTTGRIPDSMQGRLDLTASQMR